MERYKGKVAIVTGASSGIGAETARVLVESGMIVVGLARREERIRDLAGQLEAVGTLHAVKTDMTKEEDILRAFKWATENVGPLHVLVNNAGVNLHTELIDGDSEKWKSTLDLNVLGLAVASREAVKIMRANHIDGHVININSIAGHKIPNVPKFNVYPASKFAVRALTETLRLELIGLGSKIKVTSLSPGAVATEMFGTPSKKKFDSVKRFYKLDELLSGEDVANAVKFVLFTPAHVQVTELIIEPVGEVI